MPGDVPSSIDSKIVAWAAELEADPATLRGWFKAFLEEERTLHAALLSEEHILARAERRLRIRAKREYVSAGFVTGVVDAFVLGVSGAIDASQRARDAAIALFREDPQRAIADGVTDKEGTPIDTRRTFPSGKKNFRFGQPLERSLVSFAYGLASFERDGEKTKPVLFTMTVDRNLPGSKPPPRFHRVRFPFRSTEEDARSGCLKIAIPRGAEFEDLGAKDPVAIVRKLAPEIVVPLGDLDRWCETHGPFELVAVEGDVIRMDLVPSSSTGNRRISVDDGLDITGYGTTVWMPGDLDIDFAEESRVFVIGNPRPGRADSDFGASVNGLGVWALEEYKVPLPEGLKEFPAPAADREAEYAAPGWEEGGAEPGGEWGKDLAAPPAPAVSPTAKGRGTHLQGEATEWAMAAVHKMAAAEEAGAPWDTFLAASEKVGFTKAQMEAAVDALMEDGRIYEATIGRFKAAEEPTEGEKFTYGMRSKRQGLGA